jgi:hypothetical protein
MGSRALTLSALVLLTALAAPLAARADDGDGSSSEADVRVELSCSATSRVRLRVRERDDDGLRVEVDVRTPRRGTTWAVTAVHERRLALRTTRRTSLASGSFSLRFTVPDWPGRDTVTVRATGPRGELCRASATVDGD